MKLFLTCAIVAALFPFIGPWSILVALIVMNTGSNKDKYNKGRR